MRDSRAGKNIKIKPGPISIPVSFINYYTGPVIGQNDGIEKGITSQYPIAGHHHHHMPTSSSTFTLGLSSNNDNNRHQLLYNVINHGVLFFFLLLLAP